MSKNSNSEIAEIKTDMVWIKENMKDIVNKVNSMHETFIKGDGKINSLNRRVYGSSGTEGLVVKMDRVDDYLNRVKGGLIVLKIFAGLSGISLIGITVFLIKIAVATGSL